MLTVCAVALLVALPNVLSTAQMEALPDALPQQRVNLGLDLRGGSHLLLQLDLQTYYKDHFENMKEDLRLRLRKARVGYTQLEATEDGLLIELRAKEGAETLKEILTEMDPQLELRPEDGNALRFSVAFSEEAISQKRQQLLEQSIEIVNRRINQTGTKEPIIQRQGDRRILVQVPGLENPEQLKALLGETAKMTFHLVNESLSPQQLASGIAPAGTQLMPYEEEGRSALPVFRKIELSGELLTSATATFSQGQPVVAFSFNAQGARKFGQITQEHAGKRFAVVLDGKVVTAPVMRVPIMDGNGIIEGNFTVESANQLAMLLRAGALPAPLEIIEERTVGPSLGADSIAAGQYAVVISFVAIMAFMVFYYGVYGFFSNVALVFNVIIIMAALTLFQATLTLPGIAGIALTMGMAVDANTLIFERIREEYALGKSIRQSIDQGYSSAFGTILDANITTLIAAFLLFYFGSGAVKGFAVTLSIGITSSMFTAIMLTRYMMTQYVNLRKPKRLLI